jgi:predicted transcriptional regulator
VCVDCELSRGGYSEAMKWVHPIQIYCNREMVNIRLNQLLTRARSQRTSREAKIEKKLQVKQLSPAANAAIVAAYQGGARVTQIARDLGVTEGTVHHRLNVAGIIRRPTSLPDAQIKEARTLRADGLTYKKISERYGLDRARDALR